MPVVTILGIRFQNLTREEVKEQLRGILNSVPPANAKAFTPNPEMLQKAYQNAELSGLLNSAELLLSDGIGVMLAARIKGTPLLSRITGIDTGEWVLRYASSHGLSVFLLGGKEGVADAAANRLGKVLPDLNICGTHHGYFEKTTACDENQSVLDKLQQAKPDILFVCFGFPTQEKWIAENTPSLPSLKLSMGLGGALDVWSGNIKRAPKFLQKIGMEWLWRALRQPRRLGAVIRIPLFFHFVLRDIYGNRRKKQSNKKGRFSS